MGCQQKSNNEFYFILKQLLSISLLVLYLNSFTEVHELMRLPILIEHFQEHKQQVSDLTLWEFLVMHYKTDASHDDQDNDLPFKDKAHSFSVSAPSLPFQKLVLKIEAPVLEIQHTSNHKEASFKSPSQSIFQPPKLA